MNLMNYFVGRAYAQSNFSITDFRFLNPTKGPITASSLIAFVVNVILIVAALAAFIYLIIAGFQYITAGGDADKATKARTGIINALIGIIIILLAYGVLRYVGGVLFNNGVPDTIQ